MLIRCWYVVKIFIKNESKIEIFLDYVFFFFKEKKFFFVYDVSIFILKEIINEFF